MVNIKVSEKTRDELKVIKDKEELKSLDGAIRHILSMIPSFRNMRYGEYETIFRSGSAYPFYRKTRVVCSGCEKTHWLSEKNEDGIFYKYLRCNCGHETDLSPRGSYIVPDDYNPDES